GVPELLLMTQIILFCVFILTFDKTKLIRYLFIIIMPIALCLIQLLPFIHLYFHSQRQTGIGIDKWAMPGWGWANFIVPLFHYYETYQHTFTQTNQAFITSYYYPLGLIFLAIFSLFKIKNKRILLLILLTVLSLILSLGKDGYLFDFLSNYLPFFDKIRYPVKFILLTSFTIPLLAGFGSTFCKDKRFGIKALIIGLVLMAAAVLILWFNYSHPFPYDQFELTLKNCIVRFLILALFIILLTISITNKKPLIYLALFLLCFDAVKHIPNFHPKLSSEHFAPGLWEAAVHARKPTINEGRVFISPEAEEKLLRSTVSDWSANFTGKRLALWSNLNLLEQIPKVNGALTLRIKYQKEIENLLYTKSITNTVNILRFLGVKWITKPGSVIEWIEFTNSLPIITAGQQVLIMTDNEITNRLFSADFDPSTTVFISDSEQTKLATNISQSDVRIISSHISNHKVVAEYEGKSQSVLVISQSYYPLWNAYIDNVKTPLLRANYAFQAVLIPPGHHFIEVKYEDNYFIFGLIISSVLLLFIFIRIRSRRN
ncbi:MAG TPA: YfhO family protein, partial [Verrucomicrobiota bacterium]|nr:YfhO family protein [Verrucomicrobiota bacterium]